MFPTKNQLKLPTCHAADLWTWAAVFQWILSGLSASRAAFALGPRGQSQFSALSAWSQLSSFWQSGLWRKSSCTTKTRSSCTAELAANPADFVAQRKHLVIGFSDQVSLWAKATGRAVLSEQEITKMLVSGCKMDVSPSVCNLCYSASIVCLQPS